MYNNLKNIMPFFSDQLSVYIPLSKLRPTLGFSPEFYVSVDEISYDLDLNFLNPLEDQRSTNGSGLSLTSGNSLEAKPAASSLNNQSDAVAPQGMAERFLQTVKNVFVPESNDQSKLESTASAINVQFLSSQLFIVFCLF